MAPADAQRLVDCLSVMAQAVATFDERGMLLFANEAFGRLLELGPDELRPGRAWSGLLPRLLHEAESGGMDAGGTAVDRREEVDRRFWRCDAPVEFSTPGGRVLALETRRSATGDVVAILDEVTLERRRRSMLEDQALAVGEREKQLREFLQVVAHDVRAPVRQSRIQLSWLQEALRSENYPGAALYSSLMDKSLAALREMLFDLTSYYGEDKPLAPREDIDTGALVQVVLSQLDIGRRKVRVAADMPVIRAERVPLEIVIRNLLWNAVRHHDRAAGEINVSASRGQHAVVFCVTDDGPGMADEVLERLRSPGPAVPRDTSLRTSGMGLRMVRQIIESRGGGLDAARRTDARGTGVSVTWPLPCGQEPPVGPPGSTPGGPMPTGMPK